ncbi:hypothetical protein FF38_04335 [Lucilia cuprina]|uniref:Uncharacterized protein n=1 Tax=Lucilia cuprina TaxID=7375 RepID=A0A0L0BM62_LUCCU|nr:hypothetical protein FF38_04335 [Lucilia cuprina]
MLKYSLFTISIILCCSISWCVQTFEENTKFCIRTEPMLLSEIEKRIKPIDDNINCDIVATTLTVNEKESFINTMCKDHGSSHKDIYYYFKLHNGDLIGRSEYHEICQSKTNPLLAWVPYEQMQKRYAPELNPKERHNYIAKATDVQREKTELCYFRHTDLVYNISDNLFTCVVMIFEDNFYGLDSNINVLVEIKPLMYELRNITYLPTVNSTLSYKTLLGKKELKNPNSEKKEIFGNLKYAYVEKIDLNLSTVYRDDMIKLPLLFEHKNAILELDDKGIGGMDVNEKAYYGRKMEPKTKIKVDVIGQWAEHREQFNADIYEYFGYGIKRFRNEMKNGSVTFVRIESTEPVYEIPEEDDIVVAKIHSLGGKKFERLSAEEDSFGLDVNESMTLNELDNNWEDEENHTGNRPYPGFYPWFIVAVLVVAGVILAAIYGVVRNYSKKNERQNYKFTGI